MQNIKSNTQENPNDLPKIICKLDAICLQDLFGSKYGVWAVAMQAKFFMYSCASHNKAAAQWFDGCFDALTNFASRLGIAMVQMSEQPLLASASNVYWSGSNISSLKVDADMLKCFVILLEQLKIEVLLVEHQINIEPIKLICTELSNWCQAKKQEALALAGKI